MLLLEIATVAAPDDPLALWDQFTRAIADYRTVGVLGLLALAIGVVVSVLKRWQVGGGGRAPNWWLRLPRLGRRMVVASLGIVAGVIASIHGGADRGQAILLGFSGFLSILGHELAQRIGLVGSFANDQRRKRGTTPPSEPDSPPSPPAPPA